MNEIPQNVLMPSMSSAPLEAKETDLCIVGGGMSGVCAAIAAARNGARVILVQDRPVLGGNASSEVRMWICGALGRFYKESGLLEEIQLLNVYRNPGLKYSIWDTVLYEKVRAEPNIELILNAAVCEVRTEAERITAVKAWHLTRQRWLEIKAAIFMDCSGDSILRFSGARYRWGREGTLAYGEAQGREIPDRKTMGNSLLLQAREIDPAQHVPFVPPFFARKLGEDHPRAKLFKPTGDNFWWIEIGGEQDTIADADVIRDELYSIAYGVWDFIKNHPDGRGHGWELEWIGALPGKRENVRYVGGTTLTQQDIEAQGKFEDTIAYGGWTMDDHPTQAFEYAGAETTHHAAPSPYGIPYGVLYSENIENLMVAGRNLSATHMAMSSTRVMGTCALLGQAAGTAAALALGRGLSPRQVAAHRVELQNRLMDQDQWLPGLRRVLPDLTERAQVSGDKVLGDLAALRDGRERRLPDGDHWVQVEDGGFWNFVGRRRFGWNVCAWWFTAIFMM
ncbi:MAG: FAD-dependent oxidoreductase [Blastochloris sp.]|nr:FAD-dependent oxidoreductase [Blastochloris sp.]